MQTKRTLGFTLVEIMIVVAIIGLLSVLALPSFIRARKESQKQVCIQNLRNISGGKDQYMLGHDAVVPDMADLTPLMNKRTPTCPSSGSYTIGGSSEDPKCSQEAALGHKYQ